MKKSKQPAKERYHTSYKTIEGKLQLISQFNSLESILKFLDSFDMVITDFEGTLWNFDYPIPGAAETINLLKEHGKQFKLVTNTNSRNDDEYLELLKAMGIKDVKKTDIEYSLKAIARYLRKYKSSTNIFSLCSKTMNEMLAGAGVQVFSVNPQTDLTMANLATRLKPTIQVQAVIYDRNVNCTYCQLALAQQYLTSSNNCTFVVGGTETYAAVAPNVNTIGNAGFINMMTEASGKEPLILGRPGPFLGDDLKEIFQIKEPERVLFICTSIIDDVSFAISCGYKTLLIMKDQDMEMLEALTEAMKPDYLAYSIGDFVDMFNELDQLLSKRI